MEINVKSCGISDIGLVRHNNEDVLAEIPSERVYIVADGMGGHQAGEVAAREAVNTLTKLLQKSLKQKSKSLKETSKVIGDAIVSVNSHVFKMGRSVADLKGMGTTLCVLHVHEEGVVLAHVGDSRIYRFRNGALQLLTKDHSLLRELVDLGQIQEDHAGDFQYKNIITKAIGTEPHVEPSLQEEPFAPKDIYLLCSDGLSDLLSLKEMETVLKEASSLSDAAYQFVSLSKMKGGHDNVTLLMIEIEP